MNIFASVKEALRSLRANKMRSVLTMLGIFIGISAVVAMYSIGVGVKNNLASEFEAFGSDRLQIYSGGISSDGRNEKPLTAADAAAIAELPFVTAVSSADSVSGITVSRNEISGSIRVTGIDAGYLTTQGLTIEAGRDFIERERQNGSFVAILGLDNRKKFFGETNESVIGESIRIDNQAYTVVGVLADKSGGGATVNKDILIPVETLGTRLNPSRRGIRERIEVKVNTSLMQLTAAEPPIRDILRAQHGLSESAPDDFYISNIGSYLETFNAVFSIFIFFLSSVSGISLVVGGIGIMNIMLVTVTERTKEIGLRKAVGANNGNIRTQFLIESGVLSLFGGMIGILFGIGISYLVRFGASIMGYNIVPEISLIMILGACAFSILIGVFFGVYPAGRAAALQPVIALRTE